MSDEELFPADLLVDDERVLALLESLGYLLRFQNVYYFTVKGRDYFVGKKIK
jgi:hypothetical protein